MEFRGYRDGDVQAMFALDELCFTSSFRFSRRAMKQFATVENARVILAEEGEQLSGFVILHFEGPVGYIVTLDVREDARRTGLGAALMARAEALALQSGCCEVALHVFTGNDGAVRFYERCGYVFGGRVEEFYGRDPSGQKLDAWIYSKALCEPVFQSQS